MGTRSLTYFVDGIERLACLYRQHDGYPSGHGLELARLIRGMTVGNGFNLSHKRRTYANGMGDLAAWVIGKLKGNTLGSVYLYPTETDDAGQEYEYELVEQGNTLTVEVRRVEYDFGPTPLSDETIIRKTIFLGGPREFWSWCHGQKLVEEKQKRLKVAV